MSDLEVSRGREGNLQTALWALFSQRMPTPFDVIGLSLLSLKKGKVVAANAGFERLLVTADGETDTPSDELIVGRKWTALLDLKSPSEAETWLASDGCGGTAHYTQTADGERWLRLRAHSCARDEADVILNIEDVTVERIEYERARLESEHFHALIERSSEGISMFDKTSKILYESPSNKRIHGYSPEEMEGLTLIDFCHPDDAARIAVRFTHLAEAPGVVETEIVRFRHKQGHYIYLEGTVLNATDDPRIGAMVNNFRDVTGRLEAEREVRRAKSAAEESQRLQQHFLTNLSHEFKTPLTLIRGPLETLAEEVGETTHVQKNTTAGIS